MANGSDFAQYLEDLGLRRLDGQAGREAREALERFRHEADAAHQDSTNRLRREYDAPLVWSLFGQADQFDDLLVVGEMLGSIAAPPGSRVLDLGGGPGIFAGWMARCWRDSRIVVVDPAVPDDLPWRIALQGVTFVREAWPTQAARDGVAHVYPQGYGGATMLRLGRSACLRDGIDPSQTVEHFATMAAALPAVLEADASILIADYADYLPPLIEAFDRAGFEVHHMGEGWVVLIRRVDG